MSQRIFGEEAFNSLVSLLKKALSEKADQSDIAQFNSIVNSLKTTADEAKSSANSALQTAVNTQLKLQSAVDSAEVAKSESIEAKSLASDANENATKAKDLANAAQSTANEAKAQAAAAQNIAEGRTKGDTFETEADMISALKSASNKEYNVGDSIYIKEEGVPDYWVADVLPNNSGKYGYYDLVAYEGKISYKHSDLTGRDEPNQHSIESITGLPDFIQSAESSLVEIHQIFENIQNAIPKNHEDLGGRDLPNQHPMSAIEGLLETLNDAGDTISQIQRDIEELKNGGGVSVITDHNDLTGRDAEGQHPISAIDGLEQKLDSIVFEYNSLKDYVDHHVQEIKAGYANKEDVSGIAQEVENLKESISQLDVNLGQRIDQKADLASLLDLGNQVGTLETDVASIKGNINNLDERIVTLEGGGSSTVPTNHNELFGREDGDAHPIQAITGLQDYLNGAEQTLLGLQSEISSIDHRVISLENAGGGSGGVTQHNELSGRDADNAHPIASITGLEKRLKDIDNDLTSYVNDKFEETKNIRIVISQSDVANGFISFDDDRIKELFSNLNKFADYGIVINLHHNGVSQVHLTALSCDKSNIFSANAFVFSGGYLDVDGNSKVLSLNAVDGGFAIKISDDVCQGDGSGSERGKVTIYISEDELSSGNLMDSLIEIVTNIDQISNDGAQVVLPTGHQVEITQMSVDSAYFASASVAIARGSFIDWDGQKKLLTITILPQQMSGTIAITDDDSKGDFGSSAQQVTLTITDSELSSGSISNDNLMAVFNQIDDIINNGCQIVLLSTGTYVTITDMSADAEYIGNVNIMMSHGSFTDWSGKKQHLTFAIYPKEMRGTISIVEESSASSKSGVHAYKANTLGMKLDYGVYYIFVPYNQCSMSDFLLSLPYSRSDSVTVVPINGNPTVYGGGAEDWSLYRTFYAASNMLITIVVGEEKTVIWKEEML